jgi:hypothetical protein
LEGGRRCSAATDHVYYTLTLAMLVKAGQSVWNLAGKHQPENLGDRPFEVVPIEMKTK